MEAVNCRKARVLKLFSVTKKLVSEGKIKKALQNIHEKENILEPREREKLMKTFTTSIERYNESIKWNDICHS
ncbi:MAG: hypothetical protein XD75_0342 [Parcubacteria bacterium 33_209]|nr:MAG: hypothetical protein XD75_0342 [Parcubacteria bacterium 33_209]